MRIIIPGASTRFWTTRLFCSGRGETFPGEGCGALLEIQASDLFLQTIEVGKKSSCVLAVQCPECGTPTAVGAVPGPIRKAVYNVRQAPPSRTPASVG